jgi:hypothetical protein
MDTAGSPAAATGTRSPTSAGSRESSAPGTPRLQQAQQLLFTPGRRPWFDVELPGMGSAPDVTDEDALESGISFKVPRASANAEDALPASNVKSKYTGASAVKPAKAFVIGITGGSASGKTSVSELVIRSLDEPVCPDSDRAMAFMT